jgi:Flp pilus assembly protein TadG
MLNLLNTKLLMAILAALAVIGSAVLYERHESAMAAAAAAKAAAILQQQKEAEEQKARDEAFRKQVEQDRAHHNPAAAHEGKTWKTYLP